MKVLKSEEAEAKKKKKKKKRKILGMEIERDIGGDSETVSVVCKFLWAE